MDSGQPLRGFRNDGPTFYAASASFSERIVGWCSQPAASLQLVTTVMMLSLLAVGSRV
jgi:hypothetical protein